MSAYKDPDDPSFHTPPLKIDIPSDTRSMHVTLSPSRARVTCIELEKRKEKETEKEKPGIFTRLALKLKFSWRF
jgi:hypothetical protein